MANVNQIQRTNTTTVRPMINPFFGILPQALWKRTKDFFTYNADFVGTFSINAGSTVTFDIAIQADSDFLIVALARVVTDGTVDELTATGFPPLAVTIVDTGSGRQLQDRASHIENLFGTAQLPSYWPQPKLIRASSTFSTTIQNLDPGNGFQARLSYIGFKIYGY